MKEFQIKVKYKNLPTRHSEYSCISSLCRRFADEFEYGFSDKVLEIIVKQRQNMQRGKFEVVAVYKEGENPKKFLSQLAQVM